MVLPNKNNSQRDLFDGILAADTTTSGQNGPGSNKEDTPHSPKSPELETHHQIQFSITPRTLPFLEERRFTAQQKIQLVSAIPIKCK